ncbi:c-type cytochrome [Paludibaculum fermentans]|uniref:c-type cytochrome n=1 Tax=Paludibaculum fermentans TaxID=1473598 RepID=UPI003EBE6CB3
MDSRRIAQMLLVVAASSLLGACSNFPSRQPPIWVFPDMKRQDKYKPQMHSDFFADGRSSRRPVAGTLSQEMYRADETLSTGVAADNTYLAKNPLPLTKETLLHGQVKFNTYCSPCHDRTGSGRGVVPSKATWVPGNIHDDRIVGMVDGEIYHVISNGRRSMPGYRFQVSEKDRWAIVAYVRALQRSWRGTMADVPAESQAKVR